MTPAHFVPNVLAFGRVLRRAGVEVHHNRLVEAVRALEWIGVGSRDDVRATLRTLLVHRHEDLARFEAVFDAFFRPRGGPAEGLPLFSLGERPRVVARPVRGAPLNVDVEDASVEGPGRASLAVGAYSRSGVSRTKDFADFTPGELEAARRLLAGLPWQLGVRATRRWEPRGGSTPDLRKLLGQSVRRGEVLELPTRRRRAAPRPLVLLGDVSGSMERYSRVLLHFVHGLTRGARDVESFVFATSLTRITRVLAREPTRTLRARIVEDVRDWGGGTRIGEALRAFNTRWARRVMRHGPVVLIVSDGWDRGDPVELERELARVRRASRRLIWLNPLLGSSTYEPLTRGMQAALRHVDDFMPAHNLSSLERLARHLRDLPPARTAGLRGGRRPAGRSAASVV